MLNYTIEYLNRVEYVKSIESIKDVKTVNFANMSLNWWDKKFGWYIKGCMVLTDSEKNHLSYIFYKIDRNNEYITVHNIFTPLAKRRNGYANILLEMIFDLALSQNVSRFNLTSISKSLDFYISLGFIYWGVNSVGDYYCDLPIPHNGLSGVKYMVNNTNIDTLIGKKFNKIYSKIKDNSKNLSSSQTIIYDIDLIKLGESYLLNKILLIKSNTILVQKLH